MADLSEENTLHIQTEQDLEHNNSKSLSLSTDLDTAIDTSLAALPLEQEEKRLINEIIEAPNREILQQQFDAFNINQSKKNALRVIKLNTLLDKVEDQAIARFEKRPDQVSNRELLDYMTVVSNQIDRAQRSVDTLSVTPAIHVTNQTKNELNINVGTKLDRDSKERVMDAITALLKQVRNKPVDTVEGDIIDITPSEEGNSEEIEKSDSELVYSNENELDSIKDTEVLNSEMETK